MGLNAAIAVAETPTMMLGSVIADIINEAQVATRPTLHIPTDYPGKNMPTGNHPCGAIAGD